MTSEPNGIANTYRATKITLNQGLKDEDFRIAFPVGTRVSDETTDASYTVEATEDKPASKLGAGGDANAAVTTDEVSVDSPSPDANVSPGMTQRIVYAMIAVAIFAVLLLFLARKHLRS